MDPGPYTLRELVWMADVIALDHWDHTAALLCQSANMNRAKGSRIRTIEEFHPHRRATGRRGMTVAQLHDLRGLFQKTQTITIPCNP